MKVKERRMRRKMTKRVSCTSVRQAQPLPCCTPLLCLPLCLSGSSLVPFHCTAQFLTPLVSGRQVPATRHTATPWTPPQGLRLPQPPLPPPPPAATAPPAAPVEVSSACTANSANTADFLLFSLLMTTAASLLGRTGHQSDRSGS